jgi:hypothetical protein
MVELDSLAALSSGVTAMDGSFFRVEMQVGGIVAVG